MNPRGTTVNGSQGQCRMTVSPRARLHAACSEAQQRRLEEMQTQWHVVFASEAKDALVRRLLPTLPEVALPVGQAASAGHAWQQRSEELLARRREQQRLEGLGASTCTRAARPFRTAAPFPCRDSPCQRACGDDNDTVALAARRVEAGGAARRRRRYGGAGGVAGPHGRARAAAVRARDRAAARAAPGPRAALRASQRSAGGAGTGAADA